MTLALRSRLYFDHQAGIFLDVIRIFRLGSDTWLFGGPLSADLVAQKAAGQMTEA